MVPNCPVPNCPTILILPAAQMMRLLQNPEVQRRRKEDILNTGYEAEAESKAATADEEALAEPEGPKQKPEDTINTEDEAEAEKKKVF